MLKRIITLSGISILSSAALAEASNEAKCNDMEDLFVEKLEQPGDFLPPEVPASGFHTDTAEYLTRYAAGIPHDNGDTVPASSEHDTFEPFVYRYVVVFFEAGEHELSKDHKEKLEALTRNAIHPFFAIAYSDLSDIGSEAERQENEELTGKRMDAFFEMVEDDPANHCAHYKANRLPEFYDPELDKMDPKLLRRVSAVWLESEPNSR